MQTEDLETLRVMDDILEIIDCGHVQNLTDHLNQVDPTGNIKFTYEHETYGAIALLYTNVIRKPDGSISWTITASLLTPTNTCNYLPIILFSISCKDSIITENADRDKEEEFISQALATCEYPTWALNYIRLKSTRRCANRISRLRNLPTPARIKTKVWSSFPNYVEGV